MDNRCSYQSAMDMTMLIKRFSYGKDYRVKTGIIANDAA